MEYIKLEEDVINILNNFDRSSTQEVEGMKLQLLLFIAKKLDEKPLAQQGGLRKAGASNKANPMKVSGKVIWDAEVKMGKKGKFITFRIDCHETGERMSCTCFSTNAKWLFKRGEEVELEGYWSENKGYRNFVICTSNDENENESGQVQEPPIDDDIPF